MYDDDDDVFGNPFGNIEPSGVGEDVTNGDAQESDSGALTPPGQVSAGQDSGNDNRPSVLPVLAAGLLTPIGCIRGCVTGFFLLFFAIVILFAIIAQFLDMLV